MQEEQIFAQIKQFEEKGESMFLTSSFQTHSIPLLHLVSRCSKNIPIYFIHTGYLFPETLQFRDKIATLLDMEVRDLRSDIPKINQLDAQGRLLFTSNPDRCCDINKVKPMEQVLAMHDIWINGVRAAQNSNRATMKTTQSAGFGCLRYHPILNWSNKDIHEYRIKYQLPEHPLEAEGYFSIGCEPCTSKMDLTSGRDGRWYGMNKSECGLHLDLKQ